MVFHNSSLYSLLVKLIGKLEDGMIFVKRVMMRGHLSSKLMKVIIVFILMWFFIRSHHIGTFVAAQVIDGLQKL